MLYNILLGKYFYSFKYLVNWLFRASFFWRIPHIMNYLNNGYYDNEVDLKGIAWILRLYIRLNDAIHSWDIAWLNLNSFYLHLINTFSNDGPTLENVFNLLLRSLLSEIFFTNTFRVINGDNIEDFYPAYEHKYTKKVTIKYIPIENNRSSETLIKDVIIEMPRPKSV